MDDGSPNRGQENRRREDGKVRRTNFVGFRRFACLLDNRRIREMATVHSAAREIRAHEGSTNTRGYENLATNRDRGTKEKEQEMRATEITEKTKARRNREGGQWELEQPHGRPTRETRRMVVQHPRRQEE